MTRSTRIRPGAAALAATCAAPRVHGLRLLVIGCTDAAPALLADAPDDAGWHVTRAPDAPVLPDRALLDAHDLVVARAPVGTAPVALVQALRERAPDLPLVLLADAPDACRVAECLAAGADAVLDAATPAAVLRAHLRARARRGRTARGGRLPLGAAWLDPERLELLHGTRLVRLTPTEYRLLLHLARSPGGTARRAALGPRLGFAAGALSGHVRALRGKLAAVGAPCQLTNVRRGLLALRHHADDA